MDEWIKVHIPHRIYRVAQLLEIVVSLLVILAIALSLYSTALSLLGMARDPADPDNLQQFLSVAFNVVIGIEFLKMLCRHNLGTVVEVLLFATARQMVVEHTTPQENILMVAAIAILFVIRKYLFIPELDDKTSPTVERKEEALSGQDRH